MKLFNTTMLRFFTALLFIFILALINMKNEAKQVVAYRTLSERAISLETRQYDRWVNSVFKENILLNLAYLRGIQSTNQQVNWSEVTKPFTYTFTLKPGQSFAYHESVMDRYANKIVKTTQAHFNSTEGFKSDGYLVGDGVCHLASLIYWAAKDAKLDALAPTNHDFAVIPEIPKEYGVAIYNDPSNHSISSSQNLYITNNNNKPVSFSFNYDGTKLRVSVSEVVISQNLAYK